MMKKSRKLILLRILGFFLSISPLATALIINRDRYITSVSDSVRLSFGIILIVMFFIIKALGKLKIPSRTVSFALIFILSYLLSPLLDDLTLLSGLALLGEFLDNILISGKIRTTEKEIKNSEIAVAVGLKLNEMQSQSGRV